MKNDIEGNIESIVEDVDESTFDQCVQSYRQRIEELNKVSAINLNHLKDVRHLLSTTRSDTFVTIQSDL